jgi:hypothetical protein
MAGLLDVMTEAELAQARRRMSHSGAPTGDPRRALSDAALGAGRLGAAFVPGSGLADAAGYFPAEGGGYEPGVMDNVRQGDYLTALAQMAGAAGDAMYALGPAGAAVGAAAKAPRAAQLVKQGKASKAPAGQKMLREALPETADLANYLGRPTVRDPQTVAFPGIYMRPDQLVSRARVAPEDPSMKRLFGVTRDDLYETSKRKGNVEGIPFKTAAKPRGAAHAEQVMTPANEGRLLDILGEAEKRPELWKGMHAWYPMDPAYERLVELVGPEQARYHYARLNGFMGMSSPNSEVLTEINRGTGANFLAEQGRFDDFVKYGGLAEYKRGADYPDDMRAIQGHMVHSTAQAGPMAKALRSGFVDMDSAKVPSYIMASGVPDLGFQTAWPVGDAHWSRLVGLPDVRGFSRDKKSGQMAPNAASASVPEMVSLGPWWKDKVAGQAGLESVPAQAIVWGAGSNATGVTSPIGAPKLELFSQQIMKAADRMGVPPEQARDMILTGKAHAGFADPRLLGGAALGLGGGLLGYDYFNDDR